MECEQEIFWDNGGLANLMDNQNCIRNVAFFSQQTGTSDLIYKYLQESSYRINLKQTQRTLSDILQLNHKVQQKEYSMTVFFFDCSGIQAPCYATNDLIMVDGAVLIINAVEGITGKMRQIIFQLFRSKIKILLLIDSIEQIGKDSEIYAKIQSIIQQINSISKILGNGTDPSQYFLKQKIKIGSISLGCLYSSSLFKNYLPKQSLIPKASYQQLIASERTSQQQAQNEQKGRRKEIFIKMIQKIIQINSFLKNKDFQSLKVIIQDVFEREKFPNLIYQQNQFSLKNTPLDFSTSILTAIAEHLPSPLQSQFYRAQVYYPSNDKAAQEIKTCNPSNPLIAYLSRFVPNDNHQSFPYALVRILSGTIQVCDQLKIITCKHKNDQIRKVRISGVLVKSKFFHNTFQDMKRAVCGNIVFLPRLYRFAEGKATLFDDTIAHPLNFVSLLTSHKATMMKQIKPSEPADLPFLLQNLKLLQKLSTQSEIISQQMGTHYLKGDAFSIQRDFQLFKRLYNRQLIPTEEEIIYKEGPTVQSSHQLMTKSQNKHNRLYATAEPIESLLVEAIEQNKIYQNQDIYQRSQILIKQFNWEKQQTVKIFCFGPENNSPNLFIDKTVGIQQIHQFKDAMISTFQYCSKIGRLCQLQVMGMKLKLEDVNFYTDAIHRGPGQIMPAFRRLFYALQLNCQPALYEPRVKFEVFLSKSSLESFLQQMNTWKGSVLLSLNQLTYAYQVEAQISLRSYLMMSKILKKTNPSIMMNIVNQKWEHFDEKLIGSKNSLQVIMDIRLKKGMQLRIPSYVEYAQKW